jgi:hypothetical protein
VNSQQKKNVRLFFDLIEGSKFKTLLINLLWLPVNISCMQESGSSISIVSGRGLDERVIEVRSPAEAKDFSFSLCVQTGSGAHPASCTMGTGDPFTGAKARPSGDADHSPPLVPRSRMSRSYTFSPSKRLRGVYWDSFGFLSVMCRLLKLYAPWCHWSHLNRPWLYELDIN